MVKLGYKQTQEHILKRSKSRRRGDWFICWTCDNRFWRPPSHTKRGDNKFCSKKCYFSWQKGKNKTVLNPYNKQGKNNPNWRGGITPINFKIRNSNEFTKWRLEVFARDSWTCQKCFKKSKKNEYVRIEAHHVKPFALFPELRFVIENGLTLCKKCHDKEPKGKQVWNLMK